MRVERATMADLWRHCEAKAWQPSGHEYQLLVTEIVAERVWAAIASDGTPVAIGGAIGGDLGATMPRIWLSITPDIGARLPAAMRAMRRVLAAEAAPSRVLACSVRDDNPTGQRLARLLGFMATETAAGPLREWRRPA